MNRRWRSMIGLSALVSAALLFAAGSSLAKGPGGGGGGRGGGGGGGRSMGGGGGGRSMGAPSRSAPSFAGPSRLGPSASSSSASGRSGTGTWDHHGSRDGRHDHDGFHHHHHSFFFFGFPFYDPWFWGWGYPYPYFYGYFPSWYYWSDYAYDRGPVYVYDTDNGSLSSQQDPPPPPADLPKLDDNAVVIAIRVPENAEIWFDGDKTSQKGILREFVTPPLDPGQKYIYEIKASWTENGKEVNRVRKLDVVAGDRILLNMMAPEKKKSSPPEP